MTMNPEEADTLQRERERELDSAAALLRPMLETARTVIIAGEPSPDADCCGSQVALETTRAEPQS